MKRNLDLIKEILLWIQNNSDGRRDITASRIQIEGSDTQEIEMHLHRDAFTLDTGRRFNHL